VRGIIPALGCGEAAFFGLVAVVNSSEYSGSAANESGVEPPRSKGRGIFADLLVIGLLIGVCYWLVWPVGEYAILDDWAFNKSLSFLNERSELRILHWNPMSLVGHVLWGWLFTKLFGASFTVTKLSVVVLHVLEMFVVARWLRWCGVPSRGVWLAVLALMFHPLHFLHCYTFDTDIPAITWQVLGLWCIARGFASKTLPHPGPLPRSVGDSANSRHDLRWLLLGSALLGWSSWTRQHGLVAWLAVATYLVLFERRQLLHRAGWCALLPGAALLAGFMGWYQFLHGPTDVFEVSMQQTREFARNPPWSSLPEIGLTYAVYLGSFVAVLAVALPMSEWRRVGRRGATLGLIALWLLANLILYFYFERNLLFPYLRNVLTPFGLFAPNTYLLGSQPVRWGQPLAWIITVLSVLGVVALLQRLSDAEWQPRERPRWVTIRLIALWLVWQLAYIAGTTPLLFDRHLLILAPSSVLLFVVLTPSQTRWEWVPFAAVMLPLSYYSLASSHDIHAESRLAFQAGRDLIADEVPPARINGGYAFDGWHLYETHPGPVPVRPLPPWWGYRIWPHLNSLGPTSNAILNSPETAWWSGPVRPPGEVEYVISVSLPESVREGERPTFHEVRRYPFVSGWRGRTKFVYVLRRTASESSGSSAASLSPGARP
jgi:hypothetical protein